MRHIPPPSITGHGSFCQGHLYDRANNIIACDISTKSLNPERRFPQLIQKSTNFSENMMRSRESRQMMIPRPVPINANLKDNKIHHKIQRSISPKDRGDSKNRKNILNEEEQKALVDPHYLSIPASLSSIEMQKIISLDPQLEKPQRQKYLEVRINLNSDSKHSSRHAFDQILNINPQNSRSYKESEKAFKQPSIEEHQNILKEEDPKSSREKNMNLIKKSEFMKQIRDHPIESNRHTSYVQTEEAGEEGPIIESADYHIQKVNRRIKKGFSQKIKLLERLFSMSHFSPSVVFNYDVLDLNNILLELQEISLVGHICSTYLMQDEKIRWKMLSTLLYIQAYQQIMRMFFVSSESKSENALFEYLQKLAEKQIHNLDHQLDPSKQKSYFQITQLEFMIYQCKQIWENISYMLATCQVQGVIPDQMRACLKDFRNQNNFVWEGFSKTRGKISSHLMSFQKEVLKESKHFVKDILKSLSNKQWVNKYHFCLCKGLSAVFTVQRRYWMRRNRKSKPHKRIPENMIVVLETTCKQLRSSQLADEKLTKKTKEALKVYKSIIDKIKS